MPYIGRDIRTGAFRQLDDISSGFDGSDTTHTMQVNSTNVSVGDVNQILLSLGGVIQKPGTDFTVSGSTLTFTTAPAANTSFFAILLGSDNGGTVTPTDASVTTAKLADTSVTSAKLSGNLVTPGTLDVNGQELILDADADTSITADTDDQIDFKAGGTDIMSLTATTATFNDGVEITVNDNSNTLKLISTDADATNGPTLRMFRNSSSPADDDFMSRIVFSGENDASEETNYGILLTRIRDASDGTEDGQITIQNMIGGTLRNIMENDSTTTVFNDDGQDIDFRVESDDEAHMLLVEAGTNQVVIGKSGYDATVTAGTSFSSIGFSTFARSADTVMLINRLTDDGSVIKIQGQTNNEGSINVSGSTVSYNAFTGSHWSRLADNSKPTIFRGTIMESIDEMCDWYQAVADVAESTDDKGNVKPAHKIKQEISLPDGKSVGDAITFTFIETEYTGTIVKEDDVKHTKCKVSDTADSKKVYGVFSTWDDADDGLDGDVNDMMVAQVGTYIIRVNKDVTVEAGDLLVSNGDGTAKKQDDDIIRSKTVAKVNSNIKVETYEDGSYTVPCTLHC